MSSYHYKAIDDSGRVVKGQLAAFNETDVEQELSRRHGATHDTSTDEPLVDKHLRHNRVQELSVGLNPDERPVGPPQAIAWASHLPGLQQLGLTLVLPERDESA